MILEAALAAYRERDGEGRILPSAAWRDLSPGERDALFHAQIEAREIETLADPQGLSSTVKAVMERIAPGRRRARTPPPSVR